MHEKLNAFIVRAFYQRIEYKWSDSKPVLPTQSNKVCQFKGLPAKLSSCIQPFTSENR